MGTLAQAFVSLAAADVDAIARGERCQGRVGTGERGRHDADGEEHHHDVSQPSRRREQGQELVARRRDGYALLSCELHQQHAQAHEQQIGRYEGEAVGTHVFLRITKVLAGEVLLHHVLIQPRHHDNDKDAAQELLPEVLLRQPVVEHEHAAMPVVRNGRHRLRHIQVELAHHMEEDKNQGRKHADGLERVRPHQCLDAAAPRVEPDQRHHSHDRQRKRHAELIQDEPLEDDADHIEPHGSPRHLRKEKEGCSRLIGAHAQTLLQIRVDGGKIQPVVYRQKHKGHEEITDDETQAGLHVGHAGMLHHARHAHEGNTRDARAHHAEGHHIPRRPPVGPVESVVVSTANRHPAEEQQDGEICQNGENDDHNDCKDTKKRTLTERLSHFIAAARP